MSRLGRKGLEQVNLLVIVGVSVAVIFLLTIAVRNILRPSQGENEDTAIVSLKNIDAALENWYYSQSPPGHSGASLSALAQVYPSYIDSELGKGIKGGYSFMLLPLSNYEYSCIATPLSEGVTGTKTFRVTESGIVEVEVGEDWRPAE